MAAILFLAGFLSAGEGGVVEPPAPSQRDSDIVARKFVPEIPQVEEIGEILEQEATKPRQKSRKVKREVARQIIEITGLGGLFGDNVPPVVYRKVDQAIETEDPRLYEAIRLAIIRAVEDADEEDDVIALLMVA